MRKGLSCPYGQNNLIYTLSSADRALIEPELKPVKLPKGMMLEEPGKPVDLVYFPKTGVGSTVAVARNDRRIEVGLFGCDGMSGTAIVLQSDHASNETFMQIAGDGFSIEPDTLRELLDQSPTLRRHLLRYVQAMMSQISQTALSNGHGKLEERLARWLLMCHDRIRNDEMTLTHEFISVMLGVRRAGVTVGTHMLEGKGLIRANRGQIIVLDRAGLENEAWKSYGAPEADYERLIGYDQPD